MSYLFKNTTPYQAKKFHQLDREGKKYGIAILKRSMVFFNNSLIDMVTGEKVRMADEYYGDPSSSSIHFPSDMLPFKPKCDFLIIGDVSTNKAKKSWNVNLKVGDLINKSLTIHGPRYWRPIRRPKNLLQLAWDNEEKDIFEGWRLTDPEPMNSITLAYEYAYGGVHPDPDDPAGAYPYNSVGCGMIDDQHSDKTISYIAPQIEYTHDPIADPYKQYKPAGFGAISPVWQDRLQYAGTYDDQWEKERHPLLPLDFDDRFWQQSPNDQWLPKDQTYGQKVDIFGLLDKDLSFVIPKSKIYLVTLSKDEKQEEIIMHPDTITLNCNKMQLHIVYRCIFDASTTSCCEIIKQ